MRILRRKVKFVPVPVHVLNAEETADATRRLFEGSVRCSVCGELVSRHVSTEKDPQTLIIALQCMRLKAELEA
jgi:formylmethanofuran dehydrogenase subunit E